VSAPVDDLRLAADLLWPQRQPPMSLDDLRAELAPTARLRVPPLPRPSSAQACRSAALAHLLSPHAHTLLAARRLSAVYRDLDARLLPLLARAVLPGPLLDQPLLAATQRVVAAAVHDAERQLAEAAGPQLDPACEASVDRSLRRLGAPPLGGAAEDEGLPRLERLRRALAAAERRNGNRAGAHLLRLLLRCAGEVALPYFSN
jgi:hypothetical protein